MANVTYTVKKGDTLSAIAKKYNTTVSAIAKKNGIKNVNLIYPGQKLLISGTTTTKKTDTKKKTSSNKVTIDKFELQADTDTTVFVTWKWSKSYVDYYRVVWYYATGDGVWFIGSDTNEKSKQSTYNAPSNATKVKVKIKPVSTKYKNKKKKEVSHWTANWSTEKIYQFVNNPPAVPSVPSVTIEKFKLTAEVDNIDTTAKPDYIEFYIVKDDKSKFKSAKAKITTNHASYSCTVDAGSEYKVRCRAYRSKGKDYSDWTEYSTAVGTIPSTPKEITEIRANSTSSIYLAWTKVKNAKTYDIEMAVKKEYFDGTDGTSTISGIEQNHYEKLGIESGQEYFFRVRAVNEQGQSGWTGIKSIIIGKAPAAPTTWSSTTTLTVGEKLILYWVHNSKDSSSQTLAELELTINGVKQTLTIQNTTDEELKDKTSFYDQLDTSKFSEGAKINWRVRTAGITKEFGEWSILRTIDVYAPPTLELNLTDQNGGEIDVLESFPLVVSGHANPSTQIPISYHLVVTANSSYETVDDTGSEILIAAGQEVYSNYSDTNQPLLVELSAGNINLENNVEYTVTCTVAMDSGLTAEASAIFTVSWTDIWYEPNAQIAYDPETYTCTIIPYCEEYPDIYYKVAKNGEVYTKTTEVLEPLDGESVEDVYVDEDNMVYTGTTEAGEQVYFCIEESTEGILIEGVTLDVYRREYDGTFTLIEENIVNTKSTNIVDPHPSLDYARYRIVAKVIATGAISYTDLPGRLIDEPGIIIQWDEDWSAFDTKEDEEPEQPPWAGSLVRLLYNVDVAEKHNNDVEHVNYIGRRHPVSYFGTQVGETNTWNTEIIKTDVDTLYALRRLAIYMGNVYVREPSGIGYWATINVSISQKHAELTIPVQLEITRVEGGK